MEHGDHPPRMRSQGFRVVGARSLECFISLCPVGLRHQPARSGRWQLPVQRTAPDRSRDDILAFADRPAKVAPSATREMTSTVRVPRRPSLDRGGGPTYLDPRRSILTITDSTRRFLRVAGAAHAERIHPERVAPY